MWGKTKKIKNIQTFVVLIDMCLNLFFKITYNLQTKGEQSMKKQRLNIHSRSEDERGRLLSNLAFTPIQIGDIVAPSVESLLQGIKLEDKLKQNEIFKMNGIDALRTVRGIIGSKKEDAEQYVYWNKERIVYNSTKHRLRLAMFIAEKISQNEKVQEALLSTVDCFIYHDVGEENPRTSLPEKFYIEVLLKQRDLLQKLQQLS